MSRTIDFYDPTIPPAHWEVIEGFVRAAVTDSDVGTRYVARKRLGVTSRLTHWAWTVGYPLDRQVIFRREVIAEFVSKGCADLATASRGTYRSTLFAMSDVLLVGAHRHPRVPAVGKGASSRPYTVAEVALLSSWARHQRTDNRRVNATILLALGLGAGLPSADIGPLNAGDVTVDDQGVLLDVRGERPRQVPMLAEWEEPVAELALASLHKDQWLFVPRRRNATNRSLISNFLGDTTDRPMTINSQRLRATWIVTHLTAGTPVALLARAAGLESLEGLSRFVQYVPDVDVAAARRRLRSASPRRVYLDGEPL